MASQTAGIGQNVIPSKPDATAPKADVDIFNALAAALNNVVVVGAICNSDTSDNCDPECCYFDVSSLKSVPEKPNTITININVTAGPLTATATGTLTITTFAPAYSRKGHCKPPKCKNEELLVTVPYSVTGTISLNVQATGGVPLPGWFKALGSAGISITVTSSGVQDIPMKCA